MRLLLCCCILFLSLTTQAQTPIGQWRTFYNLQAGVDVALGGNNYFYATKNEVVRWRLDENTFDVYNKITGLHDANIAQIAYQYDLQTLLIAYSNGNIDLVKDEAVINIPDFYLKQLPATKTIYQVVCYQQAAYICTSIGVVVVNLQKEEVADTYVIGHNGQFATVYDMGVVDGWIFLATEEGILKAPANSAVLNNYKSWETTSPTRITQFIKGNNWLGYSNGSQVFAYKNGWQPIFQSPQPIQPIQNAWIKIGNTQYAELSTTGTTIQQFNSPEFPHPVAINLIGTQLCIADTSKGLLIQYQGNWTEALPVGMRISQPQLLLHNGKSLFVAGLNGDPICSFSNNDWTTHPIPNTQITSLAYNLQSQTLLASSLGNGLISILPNKSITQHPIPSFDTDASANNMNAVTIDAQHNTWFTFQNNPNPVVLQSTNGNFTRMAPPFFIPNNTVGNILIDGLQQKWMQLPGENGLLLLNNSNTTNWKQVTKINGNLPNNDVRSLSLDHDGNVWVGTASGLGYFPCTNTLFTNDCNAVWPVVMDNNTPSYLLKNETIHCIAVDGANRKWIGTNNGTWLVNPQGTKVITHFNTSNSPLPSNIILQIAIDPTNGEIFFATTAGLLAYRGTATGNEIAETPTNVLVFPNPVKPTYQGPIGIRGVPRNALVKITDITGQLVVQLRANGTQAVWNGKDAKGNRPQTGVYLVFAQGDDGREKSVAKIVFIN
ncbi:two component regulator with propeller domain [Chitinophaga skermanii]|uniref:Two component regulator with propeller domain n=1 Tax=Chitinophaga skermanii TaxID=331697 RepID=A0A327QHU4_9BACT|nr:two-component regulator propeller domain-containing protein [Chitinophaga skermanii]RAJ03921.1 two component regulator with propeller domain [Chitinophaga skermanii]